jgi:signal transduction histidine kinase
MGCFRKLRLAAAVIAVLGMLSALRADAVPLSPPPISAALDLSLPIPGWHTGWSFLLFAASSVTAAWLLYRLRLRQMTAKINAQFEQRLAEQTRMAQEVHEKMLQCFVSASMQVDVATDQLSDDSPIKPTLNRALQLMRQVVEEGRGAVRGLRLSRTPSLDLEEAFQLVQTEFTATGGEKPVEFRLCVRGCQKGLKPLVRDEIYRIGREALINAFRHSQAQHINADLKYGSDRFYLRVCDDGRGIDEHTLRTALTEGGLSAMSEQAKRMGARVQVFSSPRRGTEVKLTVPGQVAFADYRPRGRFPWFRQHYHSKELGA